MPRLDTYNLNLPEGVYLVQPSAPNLDQPDAEDPDQPGAPVRRPVAADDLPDAAPEALSRAPLLNAHAQKILNLQRYNDAAHSIDNAKRFSNLGKGFLTGVAIAIVAVALLIFSGLGGIVFLYAVGFTSLEQVGVALLAIVGVSTLIGGCTGDNNKCAYKDYVWNVCEELNTKPLRKIQRIAQNELDDLVQYKVIDYKTYQLILSGKTTEADWDRHHQEHLINYLPY